MRSKRKNIWSYSQIIDKIHLKRKNIANNQGQIIGAISLFATILATFRSINWRPNCSAALFVASFRSLTFGPIDRPSLTCFRKIGCLRSLRSLRQPIRGASSLRPVRSNSCSNRPAPGSNTNSFFAGRRPASAVRQKAEGFLPHRTS